VVEPCATELTVHAQLVALMPALGVTVKVVPSCVIVASGMTFVVAVTAPDHPESFTDWIEQL
jgi:hypothetical protein